MKKSVVILLGFLSLAFSATSASAQYLNTAVISQEASEIVREAGELGQVARYSNDYRVRELSNDAQQIGAAASSLLRSARGICGRSAPDYVIANEIEQTCGAIETLEDEISQISGCDFRLLEIGQSLEEALQGLRQVTGERGA